MPSPGAAVRVLEQLIDARLCEPCLAVLTGLSVDEVEGALHRLTALLTVATATSFCDRCHRFTQVSGLNPRLHRR